MVCALPSRVLPRRAAVMASNVIDTHSLEGFLNEVGEVAIRRDLGTATTFGARLNRIVSHIDRHLGDLSASQKALVDLAQMHIRAMMDCPRRMRLDNTWQDDFVHEAMTAAEALISAAKLSDSDPVSRL